MKANEAAFPVAAMCRVLDLSPSGYYGWLKRPPSARARRDAELKDRIMVIWSDSGEIYGCLRIHAVLLAEGEQVGRKRVARLMRELGIKGVTRRRFKTATMPIRSGLPESRKGAKIASSGTSRHLADVR